MTTNRAVLKMFAIALICVALVAASDGATKVRATVPGENGLIAYSRASVSDPGDIWVIAADGTGEQQLTSTSDVDFSPAFSADGSKIAFTRGQPGDIWVMDADGSNPMQLTHTGNDNGPAWSPDGTRIATYRLGDPGGIWVMDADGGNAHVLTDGDGNESFPSWSPDGTKIAFAAGGVGGNIWVIDLGTSQLSRLTSSASGDFDPDWSPDGLKIAFHSSRSGNFEVYVMDANGDNETNITHNGTNAGPTGLDLSAVWSPDGMQIAFMSGRTGDYRVWVANADGSSPTQVTDGTPTEDYPSSWQPIVAQGLKGDLDCDEDVDIDDMMRGLAYVAGFDEPISDCPDIGSGATPFGEIDCKNGLDGMDALALARFAANVPMTMDEGCRAIGS